MDNKEPLRDESLTAQPTQSQPNATQSTNIAPQPQVVVSQEPNIDPPKNPKNLIIMLAIGFLITVVLVGGAYYFVSSNNKPAEMETKQPSEPDLEVDINQVSLEDLDTEFSSVEADLQNL